MKLRVLVQNVDNLGVALRYCQTKFTKPLRTNTKCSKRFFSDHPELVARLRQNADLFLMKNGFEFRCRIGALSFKINFRHCNEIPRKT